jgi:uncharacterized DUF497 family protein
MHLVYDPEKRATTLRERGLDFEDATKVFSRTHFQMEDDREDYGETRWITVGWLNRFLVIVVWTERGDARRIISMRKCNDREREKYKSYLV